jgi:hypothetical protein
MARRKGNRSAAAAKRPVASRRKPLAKLPAPAPDAIGSLVAANIQALSQPFDPAWRDGIKFNLQLILRLAALVDEFPLPDDTEPGPVFHA